ncbi:MAG: glycosyltransferase family 4 protein [Gammaproteobacteria bacterium]|nr:glycosyltransferase family 4 protein [Gammaproteobacteria bacterium]
MELFYLFIFLLSATLTYFVRLIALKINFLDIPNHRSSHKTPTPSGGGIAIVTCFYVAIFYLFDSHLMSEINFLAILSLLVIVIIGFIDDRRHIPAKYRLIIHFIVASYITYIIGGLFDSNSLSTPLAYLGIISSVLFSVWMLNLYNFMDGIDALASIEAITVSAGAMILLYFVSDYQSIYILSCLSVSVLGFLLWNWPPAKIFMGDVASGFIGLLFALMSMITTQNNSLHFSIWLILLAYFISDSTYTLWIRFIKGEKIFESHNSHVYQILSRKYGHKPVSLSIALLNLFFLLPLAYAAQVSEAFRYVILLTAYIPILFFIQNIRKQNFG